MGVGNDFQGFALNNNNINKKKGKSGRTNVEAK